PACWSGSSANASAIVPSRRCPARRWVAGVRSRLFPEVSPAARGVTGGPVRTEAGLPSARTGGQLRHADGPRASGGLAVLIPRDVCPLGVLLRRALARDRRAGLQRRTEKLGHRLADLLT